MDLSIRTAREDDAASIAALLNPIIEAGTYTVMDGPVSVESQLAFMRGFPERGVFNVAVTDDGRRVLGLQDVQPVSAERALAHVGEISTFVALDAQRRGIGRALCRATITDARSKGFRKIVASIRADNSPAMAFYRSRGFEIVATMREHARVRGRYVDVVLAERFIVREERSAHGAAPGEKSEIRD